jgi:hypothetical protein
VLTPSAPAPARVRHPQPQKRPKSSYQCFEALLPNTRWQGDMTHWDLEGEVGVEIVNFTSISTRKRATKGQSETLCLPCSDTASPMS